MLCWFDIHMTVPYSLNRRSWLHGEITIKIVLLVFSVTPFKVDQNNHQNHTTGKVQNLGNERR